MTFDWPRIHWLIPGTYPDIRAIWHSNLASVRMRVATSVMAFQAQSNQPCTVGDQIPDHAQWVLVGKIGADCQHGRAAHWLAQLQRFKGNGGRVVVDYTDHHLGFQSKMTDFYRQAMALADACIASSAKNAAQLAQVVPLPCLVIEEPVEIEVTPPKSQFSTPTKVLWFGHGSNATYLAKFITERLVHQDTYELVALSNPGGLALLQPSLIRTRFRSQLLAWSLDTLQKFAKICDVIVIPSDPADPKKMGASSNRLITAFALGLPVVASPIDAYLPYQKYFTNIESADMFDVFNRPLDFTERAQLAQDDVVPQYSADNIQKKWVEAIYQFAGR